MKTAISEFGAILEKLGIDQIFGLPGSAIMPLYNYMYDQKSPIPVLSSHENGAAFMANAWAQVTGKIGVCVATTGPGALNLLTGVATAYSESTPLLVITGQVPLGAFSTRAYQESTSFNRSIDTVKAFEPVTKRSALATSADHFLRLVTSMIEVARQGRPGPVHISVPYPVWEQEITLPDPQRLLDALPREIADPAPHPDKVAQLAERLSRAARPLILLGNGATVGRAGRAALALAQEHGIPVVTTARGKGAVPSEHPMVAGHLGEAGRPELLRWLADRDTDLLIAAGTSLGAFSLGAAAKRVPLPAYIVMVNVDPEERGAVWPADEVVSGGARTVLEQLRIALAGTTAPHRGGAEVLPTKARPRGPELPERDEGRLHPAAALVQVRDALPEDALIIPDAGNHWIWAMRVFENRAEGRTLVGRSLGGMGQGLAAAVGAAVADPSRPVVSVTGDGCMLMHGGELAAAAGQRLPITWVVVNDSSLSRIHVAQVEDFDGRVISTALPPVNFAAFAASMGIAAKRVTEIDEVGPAIRSAIASGSPALVELVVGRASPFAA